MENKIEYYLNLVKKYGVGCVLLIFFIWSYVRLNNQYQQIVSTYQETLKDNVKILVTLDERLKKIYVVENELKEIRFEVRRTNDLLGQPVKRFTNE